jgi:hypothetical protein
VHEGWPRLKIHPLNWACAETAQDEHVLWSKWALAWQTIKLWSSCQVYRFPACTPSNVAFGSQPVLRPGWADATSAWLVDWARGRSSLARRIRKKSSFPAGLAPPVQHASYASYKMHIWATKQRYGVLVRQDRPTQTNNQTWTPCTRLAWLLRAGLVGREPNAPSVWQCDAVLLHLRWHRLCLLFLTIFLSQ